MPRGDLGFALRSALNAEKHLSKYSYFVFPDRRATMRGQLLITSSCLLLVAPSSLVMAGPVQAGAQAPRTQALVIRLGKMPRRYSCVDLERKVGDVLGFAGARDVSVRASRCEAALGGAYSPEVRMRFSFTSSPRSVRIEPGQPTSIKPSDCVLMRRLRPFLPGIVTSYRLACRAPVRLNTSAFYVSLAAAQP
jgi:hypothetical protein